MAGGSRASRRAVYGSFIVVALAAVVFPAFASSDGHPRRAGREHGVTGAIVNGHHVPIRRHPWQVALYRSAEFVGFEPICGGTIRDGRHIVTAAHCVVDEPESTEGNTSIAQAFRFRVGYGSGNVNRTRKVRVAAISVEPRFTRFAGRKRSPFGYDAAILTLTRRIRFGRHGRAPQPIEFATESQFDRYFKRGVFATGWGAIVRNGFEAPDPRLRGAALPAWSDRRCGKVYNNAKEHPFDPALMFCAGERGTRRTACRGDSGGPITIDTKRGPGVHRRLVGIVSFGRVPCGKKGTPGVFTWVQSDLLHVIHQDNPRPARTGPGLGHQTISGVRRVGHRLTCHPREIEGADATEFVWLQTSRSGDVKKFAEPRQTVTLHRSTKGKRVSCHVRYETAGGFFYVDPLRTTRPIGPLVAPLRPGGK